MENTKAKFHLFNIKAVVEDFKGGKVDEELKFTYLLIASIAVSLTISLMVMPGEEAPSVWWFDTLSSLIITIAGLKWAYRENKKGDHTDFVARYTAVGLVISADVLLVYFGLYFIGGVVAGFLQNPEFEALLTENAYVTSSTMFLVTVVANFLIVKYIKEIAQKIV